MPETMADRLRLREGHSAANEYLPPPLPVGPTARHGSSAAHRPESL